MMSWCLTAAGGEEGSDGGERADSSPAARWVPVGMRAALCLESFPRRELGLV